MRVLPILAIVTFIAGVGMLAVGYFYSGDTQAVAPANVEYFTPTPAPSPSATPTDVPSPTPTPVPYNGNITRFKIPRFNVDAAVEEIAIKKNNELDVPTNPRDVGWYNSELVAKGGPYLGAKPGFGKNAVFSAHVDYYGLPPQVMPFNKLNQLSPGDQIVVSMDNGQDYTYSVILKQNYNISDIKMGELIDAPAKPEGKEWITLITCGNTGPYVYVNGGNSGPVEYLTRDVVIAERVS